MTLGYLLQRDSGARAARNLDFCRLWLIFCNLERSRLILGLRVWNGNCPPPDSRSPNRRFEFQKRSQLFINTHDETLSVAMRVNNPDRSPLEIQSGYTAPTPTGFAEIV